MSKRYKELIENGKKNSKLLVTNNHQGFDFRKNFFQDNMIPKLHDEYMQNATAKVIKNGGEVKSNEPKELKMTEEEEPKKKKSVY